MALAFSDAVNKTQELLDSSKTMLEFGCKRCATEVVEASELLSRSCHWTLESHRNRRLHIRLCESAGGEYYFIVEIRKVSDDGATIDAFLLDDWMWHEGMSLVPYPFDVATYTGEPLEKLAGFVDFLEGELATDVISATLHGQTWPSVPSNW